MTAPAAALHSDIQLPPLSISGSARDIGEAMGCHAAARLSACVEQRLDSQVTWWRGSSRLTELQNRAAAAFPDAYAELEGIAAGARIAFGDLFLFNCLSDVPTGASQSAEGCTTFLLPASSSEPAIIAHNEDACLMASTPWFMATVQRRGHPSFTSLCYAGRMPGNAFSVNECGLVQTINDIRLLEWRPGVPRGFLARAILDCRDTRSAIELIGRTERASGYHHSLASSSDGKLYSVEAPCAGTIAVEVTRPRVHANHLLFEPLAARPQYIVGGSELRQSFGESLLGSARRATQATLRARSGGCSISQLPTVDNNWHKTIASATFEISPQGVLWTAVDARAQLLHSDRIIAPLRGKGGLP